MEKPEKSTPMQERELTDEQTGQANGGSLGYYGFCSKCGKNIYPSTKPYCEKCAPSPPKLTVK